MSLDRPDPLPEVRRRPFDEVLEEFVAKTGRPLWKVTRVIPGRTFYNLTDEQEADIVERWEAGENVYDIARRYSISHDAVVRRGRRGVKLRIFPHGTIYGYQLHRKNDETACDSCKEAWRDYGRKNSRNWRRNTKRGAA